MWVSGIDLQTKMGFYVNSTLNFTDRIPLNDANNVYANSYKLLNGRLGFRKNFDKIGIVTKLGRIEESKLNFFFLFLLIPLSRYMN